MPAVVPVADASTDRRRCAVLGSRPSRLVCVLLTVLVVAAIPSSAQALRFSSCRGNSAFGCATLPVALDHSGARPGTIKLAIAAQKRFPKSAGVLVALSGGPGQSSVDAASGFALSLAPMLRHYRLVVLDQRGTGLSGVLSCPALQAGGALDPFSPEQVLGCEQRIGSRSSFYGTRDTVGDLESLRRALGVRKIALMGVSYGTWVALDYARAHPAQTDRLILDSIVGPDRPDPFFLDSFRAFPRVLREQCGPGRCKGVTSDPVGDLRKVLARLPRGPISARVFDARGRASTVTYTTEEQLYFMVTSADLNPYMQARLPGAIAAARAGDEAPLLRLRRIAEGPPIKTRELSFGLNVTTSCLDAALPWPLDSPTAERPPLAATALAAIPPADHAPWAAETVRSSSYADDCLLFPPQPRPLPALEPLPDVPALLLGGRYDMRTPIENARATKALLPRASIVLVPGNGHDQLDTDITGCAARALRRFAVHRSVPACNPKRSDRIDPLPVPPTSLAALEAARSVRGDRGRAVTAALQSMDEARYSALEAIFAGFSPAGGGLRGGSFRATDAFDGRLTLTHYSYVPRIQVSGTLTVSGERISGTVQLAGAHSGRVTLAPSGDAFGVIDGKAFLSRRRGAAPTARAGARLARLPPPLLDRRAPARFLSARAGR